MARNEVERFFSREKRTCGAALIVTKLACTTLASIALSVLVANLFGVPFAGGGFFIVYFADASGDVPEWHFLEFLDGLEEIM